MDFPSCSVYWHNANKNLKNVAFGNKEHITASFIETLHKLS